MRDCAKIRVFQLQVTWDKINGAHPQLWAEAFNFYSEELTTTIGGPWEQQMINQQKRYPFHYTVLGLSKLLTYGSFVKSRVAIQ